MEIKQLTTPSQIMELSGLEMEELWQWAFRTQSKRPRAGINGMPLLSIGRLIEFLIDYKIPLQRIAAGLASDFHADKNVQLLDILWDCVKIILKAPKKIFKDGKEQTRYIPKSGGTMQQWASRAMWKQLSNLEQAKLKQWAVRSNDPLPRLFNAPSTDFYKTSSLYGIPMLSVGRILELLTDHGMSLLEIFKGLSLFENKEWRKQQFIDVLWDKLKLVLKSSLQKDKLVLL